MGNTFENLLIKLGKNNKPKVVAMSIAAAKGIFRPIFTMADKKQDENSKKYAATREFLTEAIAIPVYWGSGELADFLTKKIVKPKDMANDVYKKILKDFEFKEPEMIEKAKTIKKTAFKTNSVLAMFGVFLSALLVIPAVCSLTIKPIMNLVQKKNKPNVNQKKEVSPVVKSDVLAQKNNNQTFKQKVLSNQIYSAGNLGIKVGVL